MSLITLSGYKEYKDLKTPNNDLKLNSLVDFVNLFIENYCGIAFELVTVLNAKVTSDNEIDVLIPHPALNSVTRVSINEEDLDPSTYYVNLELGLVEAVLKFPRTRNGITVDYTYGFETSPADLVISAYELVSYFNKGSFSTTVTSSSGESKTSPAPVLIPPQIRLMLDMYKVS
jgi:hypothetical protein